MIITNKFNLPGPLYRALAGSDRDHVVKGDISVTGLLKPPRMATMTRRHQAEIETDASSRTWSLFGKAIHAYVARDAKSGDITERTLSVELHGLTLFGTPDYYDAETKTLYDYKVTGVASTYDGVKEEWQQQLNIYAWMLEREGFPVEHLKVQVIYRDFMDSKSGHGDYPAHPTPTFDVKKWTPEETEAFVSLRMGLHTGAGTLPDERLPACLPKERWDKPTTYAVKKIGNKTASRVLDTMEAAQEWIAQSTEEKERSKFGVEVREGESIRCARYCPVWAFCDYGKRVHEEAK
jgi:hypothetical protein